MTKTFIKGPKTSKFERYFRPELITCFPNISEKFVIFCRVCIYIRAMQSDTLHITVKPLIRTPFHKLTALHTGRINDGETPHPNSPQTLDPCMPDA